MLTNIVKVRWQIGMKTRTVILEHAKYVTKDGRVFLSGYEIHSKGEGEGVSVKGGDVMHLVELGTEDENKMFHPGDGCPKVYAMAYNPTYCELEYAHVSSGKWRPGVTAQHARIH